MKKRFSLGALLATVAVVAMLVGGPAAEVASAHSCTPGYFKNHLSVTNGLLTQAGYTSTTTLEDVFDVPDELGLDNVTIIDALSLQGGSTLSGKAEILFRAAASSLLNGIAEPNWPGPSTVNLITNVNNILATLDKSLYVSYGSELDVLNNGGPCSLS